MSKYVRKLSKAGKYSYAVTLPMSVIRELGWKLRQKVVVAKRGKGISIKDWEKGA